MHGLWPETPPYGTSACVAPLDTTPPVDVVPCYANLSCPNCADDGSALGFETHEFGKHGNCAGVANATNYLDQVCSLTAQPLAVMARARAAGGDLDALASAVAAAGYEVFSTNAATGELNLSACSNRDYKAVGPWVLAPVAGFDVACGSGQA